MSDDRGGSEGFYYKREERLQNASDSVKELSGSAPGKRRGGVFRRNRGLLIVILDIGIILLLFGIYHFFLRPDPTTAQAAGYRGELDAVVFEGETLVAVRVTMLEEDAADGLFSLRFFLNDTEVYATQDLLPRSVGEEVVVRTVLAGESDELTAIVDFGEEVTMELRSPLSGRVDRP